MMMQMAALHFPMFKIPQRFCQKFSCLVLIATGMQENCYGEEVWIFYYNEGLILPKQSIRMINYSNRAKQITVTQKLNKGCRKTGHQHYQVKKILNCYTLWQKLCEHLSTEHPILKPWALILIKLFPLCCYNSLQLFWEGFPLDGNLVVGLCVHSATRAQEVRH